MAVESVLRRIRVERDIPMRVVAARAGLTLAGYQQVEVGANGLAAGKAEAIADFFRVPIDAIFVPSTYKIRVVQEVT